MKLNATEYVAHDNGELYEFAFYDENALEPGIGFGLGFTRLHGQKDIELMLADQSIYDLKDARIEFHPTVFKLGLPQGSISPCDGGNEFEVVYEKLNADKYRDMLHYLKKILADRADIDLKHS